MTTLPDALAGIARQLADVRAGVRDGQPVEVLRRVGEIQRMLDAIVVDVVDDIETEDASRERADRTISRAGCRDAAELLQRTLLVDRPTARRYVTAAGMVHEDVALSGERLPGDFPVLSAALRAGEMSLTGYMACVVPLRRAQSRIAPADMAVADEVLAGAATGRDIAGEEAGETEDAGARAPRPTVEELAGLVAHVLLRIDPDGAVPEDREGERNRAFSIGRLHDGSVPVRGSLLPEVAASLLRLMDAYNNPRVGFATRGWDSRRRLRNWSWARMLIRMSHPRPRRTCAHRPRSGTMRSRRS